jgi:hypothetical protein
MLDTAVNTSSALRAVVVSVGLDSLLFLKYILLSEKYVEKYVDAYK